MKENDRLKFLEVLFDIDDKVAFGMDNRSACKPISPLPEWKYTKANKFCINPLRNWRDGQNVTQINALLFEMDKDENGEIIDPKKQIRMFLDSGIPYSTLVFSGTKSVHCIVRFTEPIEEKWFRSWWEAINRVLTSKGLPIDPHTMKIPQLSRVPGSIRIDKDKETGKEIVGKEQKLIHINRRVTQDEVRDWLSTNNEEVKEPYVPPVRLYEPDMNAQIDDKELWQAAYNMNAKKHGDYSATAQSGNWMYLIDLANYFYRVDLSLNAAISICNTEFGTKGLSSSGEFFIEEPLTKGYTWAEKNGLEKIKVTSKAEYMEERRQERLQNATSTNEPDMSDILSVLDEEVPYDQDPNNYCWIGSDIFLVYPDKSMVKYSSPGFKARFPGRDNVLASDLDKYSGFGYEPDYFKATNRLRHNKFNMFKTPQVKIEKGKWPMTEILLRHIFGDLYEFGLEYYWVLRNKPKQALPAIALTGGEDGGKSSFAKHLEMCFNNYIAIDTDKLVSNENNYVANRQIIVVEESDAKGSNKLTSADAISNKIKMYVTECGGKVPFKKLFDNAGSIEYFGHIILLTNDITPIKMSGEATRYAVLHIGKPKKIQDFMIRLEKEVGHFLYYLDNEYKPSRTESKERLWFHPDEYFTEAKDIAKTESGTYIYKRIKDALKMWFDDNEDEVCYFDLQSLKNYVFSVSDDDFKKSQIKDCLLKEFKYNDPVRASKLDSLADKIKGESNTRKMLYWAIKQDLTEYKVVNEYY